MGKVKYLLCGLLASEDGDSIKWMFDTFKQHNDRWEAIHVVMADKDLKRVRYY